MKCIPGPTGTWSWIMSTVYHNANKYLSNARCSKDNTSYLGDVSGWWKLSHVLSNCQVAGVDELGRAC